MLVNIRPILLCDRLVSVIYEQDSVPHNRISRLHTGKGDGIIRQSDPDRQTGGS